MKFIKLLCVSIFSILFVLKAGSAKADDYYVEVQNLTGYTIFFLYVSPSKSSSWEEDVLGSDVLMHGDTNRINLYGYNSPYFDVRAIDEDGDSYVRWQVNVLREDVTFTLGDMIIE